MAFDGLVIEWFKVDANAPAVAKTIGELGIRKKYNVNVVAVLKKNMKKLFTPGPESLIEAGDTLVVSGERPEVKKFTNELLMKIGDV